MTPHLLLLTDLNGTQFLVPVHAIEQITPREPGAEIFTLTGESFQVTESFVAIIRALGGLVMQPHEEME